MTDPDAVATWRAVLLAQDRVARALERDLTAAGVLPLSWYDVLVELHAEASGQLRMQELAARVVLSRTRVSRLVGELEAAGLVERRSDPGDGRAALATITRAGRAAVRRTAPVYTGAIERHLGRHLTPAQQRTITDALQHVVGAHQLDHRR